MTFTTASTGKSKKFAMPSAIWYRFATKTFVTKKGT